MTNLEVMNLSPCSIATTNGRGKKIPLDVTKKEENNISTESKCHLETTVKDDDYKTNLKKYSSQSERPRHETLPRISMYKRRTHLNKTSKDGRIISSGSKSRDYHQPADDPNTHSDTSSVYDSVSRTESEKSKESQYSKDRTARTKNSPAISSSSSKIRYYHITINGQSAHSNTTSIRDSISMRESEKSKDLKYSEKRLARTKHSPHRLSSTSNIRDYSRPIRNQNTHSETSVIHDSISRKETEKSINSRYSKERLVRTKKFTNISKDSLHHRSSSTNRSNKSFHNESRYKSRTRHRTSPNRVPCSSKNPCSSCTASMSDKHSKDRDRTPNNIKSYTYNITIPRFLEEEQELRQKIDTQINEYTSNPQSHPQHDKEWIKFATSKCNSNSTSQGTDLSDQYKEEWENVWNEIIKDKYEKTFVNKRRSLMLQYDIDFADIEKYRTEQTSSTVKGVTDICTLKEPSEVYKSSKPKRDKMAIISPSREEKIKASINMKIKETLQLSGETINEDEIAQSTNEIYNKNRETFVKDTISFQEKSTVSPMSGTSIQLHELFTLSQKHVKLLTEQGKQLEHPKNENNFVSGEINWQDIATAIANIKQEGKN